MQGICLYHLGNRDGAKQCLLRSQEAEPSAETMSYLRWLEEAANDA